MDSEEQRIMSVINDLPIQPVGAYALVQPNALDPQPFVLYKHDTYTLLLRPHSLFDLNVYDLFEVVLMSQEQIVFKEDIFIEDAGKTGIRDVIREYNQHAPVTSLIN